MYELDPSSIVKRKMFKIILILTLYLLECSRTYSHSEINTQLMSFFGGDLESWWWAVTRGTQAGRK